MFNKAVHRGPFLVAGLLCGLHGVPGLALTALAGQDILTREILRIGVLEGERHQEFGLVQGVAGGPFGHVFVLDSRMHVVRAFDESGAHVSAFGRPGAGPEEFSHLVGLHVQDGRTLLILDAGNARLTELRLTEAGLERVGSMRTPIPSQDFCVLGNRIFFLGYFEGKVIHEINRSGAWVRSFGDPPAAASEFAANVLTGGKLTCVHDDRGGMIIHASRLLPWVASYSADGRRRWVTNLSGFDVMEVEAARGRVVFRAPPGGSANVIVSAVPVIVPFGAYLLVQFGRQGAGHAASPEEMVEVQTRVLSLDSGQELRTLAHLPRIDHVRDGRAYSIENVPFPQVVVHTLEVRR